MARDIFSSLKTLLAQFQEGEKNGSDLIKALNAWARESGDLIKDKVEEEGERSVKKMGFVKREQFAALESRVRELEKSTKASNKKSGSRPVKNNVTKKTVKKSAQKAGKR